MNENATMLMLLLAAVALLVTLQPGPDGTAVGRNANASVAGRLEAMGLEVADVGVISQSFMPVEGSVITADGQGVQIYEFQSEKAAGAFASTVSRDGTQIGTSIATWIDTPHFYESGRLIVIYVGSSGRIDKALSSFMAKFAGGYKTCAERGSVCVQVYQPVCGFLQGGKQTYPNSCVACNSGALYYAEGECGK